MLKAASAGSTGSDSYVDEGDVGGSMMVVAVGGEEELDPSETKVRCRRYLNISAGSQPEIHLPDLPATHLGIQTADLLTTRPCWT